MKKSIIFFGLIVIMSSMFLAQGTSLYPQLIDSSSNQIITEITKIEYDCGGCLSGDNCYMIGTRSGIGYCSESKDMLYQKYPEEPCLENYECFYNICDSEKCSYPKYISVKEKAKGKSFIAKEIIYSSSKKTFSLQGLNNNYYNIEIRTVNNSIKISGLPIKKSEKEIYKNNYDDIGLETLMLGSYDSSYHYLLNESSFFIDNLNKTQIIINNYSIDGTVIKINFTLIDSIIPIPFNDGNYYLCEGYYLPNKCYTTGDSFKVLNESYYVVNKTFDIKKQFGDSCEFDYECKNNFCNNGICFFDIRINNSKNKENNTSKTITGAIVNTNPIINTISHKIYCWLFKNNNFCKNE